MRLSEVAFASLCIAIAISMSSSIVCPHGYSAEPLTRVPVEVQMRNLNLRLDRLIVMSNRS